MVEAAIEIETCRGLCCLIRFDGFHVYICASLLLRFAKPLKSMGFQEIVQFLQQLPTRSWGLSDVEELLSQAYIYKASFDSSPSHLSG